MTWLLLLALLACDRGGESSSTEPPPPRAPNDRAASDVAPSAGEPSSDRAVDPIDWRPWEFPEAGLRIDVAAGVEPRRIDRHGETYARPDAIQGEPDDRYLVQRIGEDLVLRLSAGVHASLEAWVQPGELGERVVTEPPEPVTVCETRALRQVARRIVERRVTHTTGDELHGAERDRTAVAVAFVREEGPVLVEWIVDTAHRDRYAHAEEHYFASLRCSNAAESAGE